jgi:hypothetical protein
MVHNPGNLIVVTDGHSLHMRVARVHHRDYPEVRGEGRSLREATRHLAFKLGRGLDHAHGQRRLALERAVADVVAALRGFGYAARFATARAI